MQATVNKILQYLDTGKPELALPLCEQLLTEMPSHPGALQLSMVVQAESGDLDRATALYEQLCLSQGADPELHYNFGRALLKADALDAAEQAFREAIKNAPSHLSALNNLAIVLQRMQQVEQAEALFRKVLVMQPDYANARLNLGHLLMQKQQFIEAQHLLQTVVDRTPNHAEAWYGLGLCYQRDEQHQHAVDAFNRATQLSPDPGDACNAMGISLNALGQFEAALQAYEQALQTRGDDPSVHNNLANCLVNGGGDLERAEQAYRRALELNEQAETHANLATVYELANRVDQARTSAEQALELDSDNVAAHLVMARVERRAGQLEAARDRLLRVKPMASDIREQKECAFELGQVLDKLKQCDDAFEQFSEGNRLALQWWQMQSPPALDYATTVRDIAAVSTRLDVTANTAIDQANPVFLLGFQRSGNTLLDTVLDAHGGFAVLEEKPLLVQLTEQMDYPADLARLDSRQLDEIREQYFAGVQNELGDYENRVLIDKSPLSSVHLGFIEQLFPTARVVVALRHPLDVVLSCFMQDFALNPVLANYTSLQGVADVYSAVMSTLLAHERRPVLQYHRIKYEDLVGDFDQAVGDCLHFLDVPWNDAVRDFAEHGRARGVLNTPSYHQVTSGLYTTARERWRRYEKHLAAVRPTLQPFIRDFGYDH